jgi:predicted dithiol-disulfide oxidoreductase (DUF899 family)
MNYTETKTALDTRRKKISALQEEMRGLQAEVEPQVVQDYQLTGWEGPVRLSELFGSHKELIVIHNMGVGCSACTMWADGFNGVYDHLASRASFVVSSPNPVDVQKTFAAGRGWRFPMVSHAGTTFAEDLGYRRPDKARKVTAAGGRVCRSFAVRTARSSGSPTRNSDRWIRSARSITSLRWSPAQTPSGIRNTDTPNSARV